jgi:hypothetical protein
MKYIILVIGLLVVGCGTITTEDVIGSYDSYFFTQSRLVFQQNGLVETYTLTKGWSSELLDKPVKTGTSEWSIFGGRLCLHFPLITEDGEFTAEELKFWKGAKIFYKRERNGDLITIYVKLKDGKRHYFKKEDQLTLKRIKNTMPSKLD